MASDRAAIADVPVPVDCCRRVSGVKTRGVQWPVRPWGVSRNSEGIGVMPNTNSKRVSCVRDQCRSFAQVHAGPGTLLTTRVAKQNDGAELEPQW